MPLGTLGNVDLLTNLGEVIGSYIFSERKYKGY